ncbi:MAG: aspartate carbamoyltransferase regulatory subunit [Firmicutes bacterium]|jgi:aspartate carbamoyltransferase regulatory subunit|nr:aspartate carbamoyltransferase regulatory subunit [Bacillota bacterium]MBQ3287483.1 aspartate carbamoyltransferase regulatory subunit [Bacillota bacterium]MBQ6606660.1 aspartate carbamoyltransferase regulatory subunit [Bacillota bacterium]MBR0178899.1 aspartate carbamoyltransferase regulatory subunit [Bacillota bacterium]
MIIGSIVNGIVIDHIPAGRGMELYRYLKLDDMECEVALIKNASSDKYGKKDILKVNEVIDLDFDMLGYIAPQITVNIIRNGERVEKVHPKLPETITGVLRCKNPRCITSIEQELQHVFKLTDREHGVYRCIYCDTKAEKQSLV